MANRLASRVYRYAIRILRKTWMNSGYQGKKLTPLEQAVCENGLRMIPGKTHDWVQYNRHISRYKFFKELIENDRQKKNISILDLGCGSGYGPALLSTIPGSDVVGIDISRQTVDYANKTHHARNLCFAAHDISDYVKTMPPYDYVVSSHAIEHIGNGTSLVGLIRFNNMCIIATPYNDATGADKNHITKGITEQSYKDISHKVFYYDDYWGKIHTTKPDNIFFSIICLVRKEH